MHGLVRTKRSAERSPSLVPGVFCPAIPSEFPLSWVPELLLSTPAWLLALGHVALDSVLPDLDALTLRCRSS